LIKKSDLKASGNPNLKKTTKEQNNNPLQEISVFKRTKVLLAKAGLDDFLIALIFVIVLAYLWPNPGVKQGTFSISNLANYGISAIFFFYGLRLSPEKFRAGLSNWKLHLTVHSATFLLFPLMVLFFHRFFRDESTELLWMGTFFLAALPSTVSSSVVMVSIARGNLPAAIFNASVSSLLGVFITPLWMGLFLSSTMGDYNLWEVIGKLMLQVLFPVLLGIALYSRLGATAERYKKQLKYFDQFIILMIVYTSFSESFAEKMFSAFSLADIVILGILMITLFFLMYFLILFISRMLGFNREDKITALFCGSKKSLVQGTVMSKVLFPLSTNLGVILLPIMLYHALQLILVSIIAQAMSKQPLVVEKE